MNNGIVYHNHVARSASGKIMSKETMDILGHQKAVNYVFNPALTKHIFTKAILPGLIPPLAYFSTVTGGFTNIEKQSCPEPITSLLLR